MGASLPFDGAGFDGGGLGGRNAGIGAGRIRSPKIVCGFGGGRVALRLSFLSMELSPVFCFFLFTMLASLSLPFLCRFVLSLPAAPFPLGGLLV